MLGIKIFELIPESESFHNIRNLYKYGPALQAEFLKQVCCIDPELFEQIHSNSKLRPYTISPPLEKNEQLYWKITALNQQMSKVLDKVSFDKIILEKESIHLAVRPIMSEFITYTDLYNIYFLETKDLDKRLDFKFLTPTSFRKSNTNVYLPLPIPSYIFQSLINKWSEFSSFGEVKYPGELEFIDNSIFIAEHNIKTRLFYIDKGKITGFIGTLSIRTNNDEQLLKLISMLSHYSTYCGIGIKTSMGMGQVTINVEKDFFN